MHVATKSMELVSGVGIVLNESQDIETFGMNLFDGCHFVVLLVVLDMVLNVEYHGTVRVCYFVAVMKKLINRKK